MLPQQPPYAAYADLVPVGQLLPQRPRVILLDQSCTSSSVSRWLTFHARVLRSDRTLTGSTAGPASLRFGQRCQRVLKVAEHVRPV